MTEFITRVRYGERRYEVIIKTDNEGHYNAAEKFARSLIDHEKPQTNADRIRAMSDDKLAEFLFGFEYATGELGACWECQGEALQWLREPADQDDEEEGDPTGEEARAAVLGKLAKECPECGAKMIGGEENGKE